ncbi:MAG: dTDP-4-dehydrorhamnose 3,5-epimerase [Proteobacteria bacterium]|nr:dTDP-4-dehydrorhamnose 3,5-epimerase [Pseudomonadota bacterium]
MGKLFLLKPKRFGDARGWFMETYSEKAFAALGLHHGFVQDNHSFSAESGTLRGLHFQTPPFAQAKLVRCTRGAMFDVAVDVQRGSPTYGQWIGCELSAQNGHQLYIPVGFAHGFVTLTADCEVQYKVSAPYAPANDGGILWSDPDIAVTWPLAEDVKPTLSGKDEVLPLLSGFESPFDYDGVPMELLEV